MTKGTAQLRIWTTTCFTARPYQAPSCSQLRPHQANIVESEQHIAYFTENIHFTMARQRPKKHGLLKFGKSHSTSNTPPGSLQVPAVDTASTTKTSGNGFRGSLTGMRRFFSRSNHSQPSSVAPEIVGTSAGGGTQEQQEQPQITPAQDNQLVINETEPEPALGVDDAERAFNNTDPMSRLSEGPVNIINDANTAFTDILNLTDMYLVPFKLFNTMVTTLYGVHPYAQIALGVLTAASGLLIEQANLDMAVFGLLQAIRTVYIFLMEEDTISNIDINQRLF
ncbi:hypothetical protein EDD17DRAFT_226917 [Pisolithus thermaeus]|nr:hypothetical protein EV401DRAFT_1579292 [Pisolithus croceorrhizus]KAI6165409.1 hypothetical protein EDD17DRAFT_226917 [Pisolithus thermaeus]